MAQENPAEGNWKGRSIRENPFAMKWQHTARSEKDYVRAPARIQKAFDKQIDLAVGNLLHPSLHAKKYDESAGLWQARVNRDWRFYFIIDRGTLVIVRIVPHPK